MYAYLGFSKGGWDINEIHTSHSIMGEALSFLFGANSWKILRNTCKVYTENKTKIQRAAKNCTSPVKCSEHISFYYEKCPLLCTVTTTPKCGNLVLKYFSSGYQFHIAVGLYMHMEVCKFL